MFELNYLSIQTLNLYSGWSPGTQGRLSNGLHRADAHRRAGGRPTDCGHHGWAERQKNADRVLCPRALRRVRKTEGLEWQMTMSVFPRAHECKRSVNRNI